MNDYCIVTDPSANLPEEYFREKGILLYDVPYLLDGVTYTKDTPLDASSFYEALRKGSSASTTEPSVENATEYLQNLVLEKEMDVIVITVSSRLGVINSSMNAAAEIVQKKFPQYKITVIDSLCASLGEGIMVDMALNLKRRGFLYNENIAWLERVRHQVLHLFTVDDLTALSRGKKIPKSVAVLGTLANVKISFRLDENGFIALNKPFLSRTRAIEHIVDTLGERIGSYSKKNETIYISHGDCEKDAMLLKEKITERYGFTNFMIVPLCPTLGCFAGPGALSIFYLGEKR